jgi:broad specificity phosphatase PhoE
VPRLYLVRHAEPAALWGAHPDPGLSGLGVAQAKAAAVHLAGLGVTNLITSPLARCRETARPTEAALSIEAPVNRAVAEIPVPDDVENHRAWLTAVLSGAWSDGHVGSALIAWRAQIGDTLLALEQDTVIFSHFVAINAAVGLATDSERVTVFKPGHASVTILESDSRVLRLVELGAESAINLA